MVYEPLDAISDGHQWFNMINNTVTVSNKDTYIRNEKHSNTPYIQNEHIEHFLDQHQLEQGVHQQTTTRRKQ